MEKEAIWEVVKLATCDAVKAAIASAPVVVFSKTYCPCVCQALCAGETLATDGQRA